MLAKINHVEAFILTDQIVFHHECEDSREDHSEFLLFFLPGFVSPSLANIHVHDLFIFLAVFLAATAFLIQFILFSGVDLILTTRSLMAFV